MLNTFVQLEGEKRSRLSPRDHPVEKKKLFLLLSGNVPQINPDQREGVPYIDAVQLLELMCQVKRLGLAYPWAEAECDNFVCL